MTAEIVVVRRREGGEGIHGGRGGGRDWNGKKADDRIIDGELLLLLT